MISKEAVRLAQRGTLTALSGALAAICMVLCVSCSSTTDAEKTDASPESGGNVGSGGKSTGGVPATSGGNGGGGNGGQSTGGRAAGTGGAGTSGAGGGGGSTMYRDCIGPGYYCSAGAVSVVERSGVPAGESCVRFVYRCATGCRVDHFAPSSGSTPALPAPASLCNEWDGGVVDAGSADASDSGACEGGAEAGCSR